MKTVLQEFIEYLEGIEKRDNLPSWVITTGKNYLESEKQQIIDAYRNGRCDQQSSRESIFYSRMAEQYYNETFKK